MSDKHTTQANPSAKTYEGWSNFETWCVNLWIANEEPAYNFWNERARDYRKQEVDTLYCAERLASELESAIKDAQPELDGMWSDLLSAALSEVNWFEIATDILQGVSER